MKTFKDVKGCDDAKQELEEVVEYLKNPTKFTRLGGKLPKVCLSLHRDIYLPLIIDGCKCYRHFIQHYSSNAGQLYVCFLHEFL